MVDIGDNFERWICSFMPKLIEVSDDYCCIRFIINNLE